MDIVMWSAEEADAMHAGYKRRAGIPAAGTEPLFAAAMVGYRKAHSEAATEIEQLRRELAERDALLQSVIDASQQLRCDLRYAVVNGSETINPFGEDVPVAAISTIGEASFRGKDWGEFWQQIDRAATAIASGSYRDSGNE